VTIGDLGKVLIGLGLVIVVVGLALTLGSRLPWIGRLPGDLYVRRENWSFYFPIATSLLISAVLTLIFWLFGRR
jgi:hypothetical protein